MLGSHGQRLKRKPWEESIRVPGILRYPARVKPGRTTDALLTHVDLAPTLLALCGLPVPDDMQGTDLSGAGARRRRIEGRTRPSSRSSSRSPGTGRPNPWRGVRTDRFMYARTEAGPWVLYDLKDDPYELKNLADDPAHARLERRTGGEAGRLDEADRRLLGQ